MAKSRITSFFGLLILLSFTLLFPCGCKSNGNGNNAIGEIAATPIAADGMLYFGTKDGNLYALDEHTGKIIWTYDTEGAILTSATEASGTVYFGNDSYGLYALDAGTGEFLWTSSLSAWPCTAPIFHQGKVLIGTVMDPGAYDIYVKNAVDGGDLYVSSTNPYPGMPNLCGNKLLIEQGNRALKSDAFSDIAAVDDSNGKVIWRFQIENKDLHFFDAIDGLVFCIGNDESYVTDSLYALDTETGELRWENRIEQQGLIGIAGDRLILSHYEDQGQPKKTTVISAIDTITGELEWECGIENPVYIRSYYGARDRFKGRRLLEEDGVLYSFSLEQDTGQLYLNAIELETGKQLSKNPVAFSPNSPDPPPIIIDGTIYVENHIIEHRKKDTVYITKVGAIDSTSGELLWSYEVEVDQLEYWDLEPDLVVDDGLFFLITKENGFGCIRALDVETGKVVWKLGG